MINYPEEFIEKCKKIYPDYERLHELLDQGHVMVGRYLDDCSYGGISIVEILSATSLEELKAKANLIKQKKQLYSDWNEICNQTKI